MKSILRTYELGSAFNIPVRLHWSALIATICLPFIALVIGERTVVTALRDVGMYASIYFFVLLHEFGHALVAKRFGIACKSITIYLFGGNAEISLRGIYAEPPKLVSVKEFWIAVAGPAVNVALAPVFIVAFALTGLVGMSSEHYVVDGLLWCVFINSLIAVFNLLPIFPLDGGRIMRALVLNFTCSFVRATEIIVRVSQVLAVFVICFAVFSVNILLLVMAALAILISEAELSIVRKGDQASGNA